MTQASLETGNLLLSKRPVTITHDPFCFFYVDDFLPRDFYQSLLDSYPADHLYSYDRDGKMGFRSSKDPGEVARFCASNPAWQQMIDFLGSDEFLYDARTTFEPALVQARGWGGRKRWYNCTDRAVSDNWLRYCIQEPVRSTFQFSQLTRDASIVPHADAPRKLISLLLYFQDPGWDDAWGGATEYYAPLDPEKARGWSETERIPFDEFRVIGTTPFVGNRLAGFVRSSNSWHGVPALVCPPGAGRKCLLINIKRLKWSKRHRL